VLQAHGHDDRIRTGRAHLPLAVGESGRFSAAPR
jgi:hypothetical protein